MSNTRKACRQETARLLAGTNFVVSTASADGASTGLTLIDYSYKSSLLQDGHFVGFPVYLTSGMWASLWRRVASYAASTGAYTFDEPFKFAADGTGVTTDTSAKTLTDTRQSWTVDQYVGAVVTCKTETLTVTSNTATVLTGTGSWSGDPGNGESYTITYAVMTAVEYEMHPTIHPERINEAVDRALRKMLYDTTALPSLLADADMEASGTTSWTASNATLSKDTTAANIFRGTQSLKIVDSGSGGGYAYQTFEVVAGDSYFLWAPTKNATAGNIARLKVYDVTTPADIEYEDSTSSNWQILAFSFVVPSGCTQIRIELSSVTTSATTYWDQVQLLRKADRRHVLPTWVTEIWQVGRTVYQYEGANLVNDGTMPDQRAALSWPHIRPKKELARVYIAPDPPFRNEAAVYVECLRHYSALATDAATTDADLDWIATKAKYECLRMLAAPLVPSEERGEFRKALEEAKMEAASMDARFMPKIEQPFGFGEERLFSLQEI